MTAFVRELFYIDRGGYITYGPEYRTAKFVARFKYQRAAAKTYVTFLIKNFTVEEYFAIQAAHELDRKVTSAYHTAEERGYIMPHIKKWLRDRGYEVSHAGQKQMLADTVAASLARIDAAKLAA